MPRGKVHLALELGTLPLWVALGATLELGRASLVFFAGAYVTGSLFLSPDLDLTRSDAARRWRRARFLWRPYAALFRHRGVSHSPFVGPLTRLLYLGAIGAAVWAILHVLIRIPLPRSVALHSALPVLVGVFAPQLLHVALDRIATLSRHWR